MATPRTLLQRLRAIWPHALTVLADGGANDGVGVEVTGTSDGAVNVSAVDKAISFVAASNVDCTSAAPLTATTGAGYIIVTNLDASATIYLGDSDVTGSTDGEAIPAGQTRIWYSADLSAEYGIGSSTVNVSVRR